MVRIPISCQICSRMAALMRRPSSCRTTTYLAGTSIPHIHSATGQAVATHSGMTSTTLSRACLSVTAILTSLRSSGTSSIPSGPDASRPRFLYQTSVLLAQWASGSDLCEASFSALAIPGDARAERDHNSVLEVLDREASFFSFLARIPDLCDLSTLCENRLRQNRVLVIWRVPAMEEQPASTTVLGSAIVEWLADEALQDSEPAILYGELCQRLRGVGMPILRSQVAFRERNALSHR